MAANPQVPPFPPAPPWTAGPHYPDATRLRTCSHSLHEYTIPVQEYQPPTKTASASALSRSFEPPSVVSLYAQLADRTSGCWAVVCVWLIYDFHPK